MKIRKSKGLLIILMVIAFFSSIFIELWAFAHVNQSINTAMDISNPEIHAYFIKIAGNLIIQEKTIVKLKSNTDYLIKHGATGVHTVEIRYIKIMCMNTLNGGERSTVLPFLFMRWTGMNILI